MIDEGITWIDWKSKKVLRKGGVRPQIIATTWNVYFIPFWVFISIIKKNFFSGQPGPIYHNGDDSRQGFEVTSSIKQR